MELTVNDKTYIVSDPQPYANINGIESHQIFLDNELVWTLVHYKASKRFALQGYMKRRELVAKHFPEAIEEIAKFL